MYFKKRKSEGFRIAPTSDRVIGEGVSEPILIVASTCYLIFLIFKFNFEIYYDIGLMNVLEHVRVRFGNATANGAALSFFSSQVVAAYLAFANKEDEVAYQRLKTKKAWFYYFAFAALFIFLGWGLMFFMFHQYPSDFFSDSRVNEFQALVFSGEAAFGIYLIGSCWVCSTGVYMIFKAIKKIIFNLWWTKHLRSLFFWLG